MKNFIKKFLSAFTAILLTLSIMPMYAMPVFADSLGDFTPYFTDVKITTINDTPLPVIVAKNSDIKITFDYAFLTSDLPIGTYSFTLPVAIAASAPSTSIVDNGFTIANINSDAAGNATITFTTEALDNGYLDQNSTGRFEFHITLNKDNIPNAAKDITFFESTANEKKINMAFAFDQIEADGLISLNVGAIDYANSSIPWAISVSPTLKNANALVVNENKINNLIITSPVAKGLTILGTPTLSLNGAALQPEDYTIEASGTAAAGQTIKCTLNSSYNYFYTQNDKFELKYNTSYDLAAFAKSNKTDFTNKASSSFDYNQYQQSSATGEISLATVGLTKSIAETSAKATLQSAVLSKDLTYDKAKQLIHWTLTVNADKINFDSVYNVTDNIPQGLKLTANSVKIAYDDGAEQAATYTYSPAAYEGGTLTITNVNTASKAVIKYETEIDPIIWQTQPTKSFNNTVSYTALLNGNGYTFGREKKLDAEFGGANGGLIGATGSYDRTNHTFTWNTAVNSNNTALNNGVVTIFIPTGHSFVDGSVVLDGAVQAATIGAITPVSGGNNFVVTLPPSINSPGNIKFKTTVDNPKFWATNNANTPYSIKAGLTNGKINLSASPNVDAVTKVIEKSSANANGYDYNKKEIKWKIDINQNKMAMTNPVITDVLPDGLSYKQGSATANGTSILADGVNFAEDTRTLTIKLDNINIGSSPFVEFVTIVNDDSYLKLPSKPVKNTASIAFNELGTESAVSHTYSRNIGSPPLTKTGKQNTSYRNYTWAVNINPNMADLGAITLSDTLPDGLVMDLDSIKLYEANPAQYTGALSQGALVYDGKSPLKYPNYTALLDGQKFSFKFNISISKAYILVFDTDNTNNGSASYANTIMFEGDSPSKSSTASIAQGVAGSSGTANPNRGFIKINSKIGAVGNTNLAGVIYTITGTNPKNVYSATTNSAGIAMFNPVKFDTYSVSVTFVPNGYTALSDTSEITITGTKRSQSSTLRYDMGTPITISYKGNGYTGGTQPPQATYAPNAIGIKALPNTFTRINAIFVKWNTAQDGSGTDYAPGDIITVGSSDVTLYAIWKANPVEPDKPIVPDKPVKPDEPVIPDKPVTPTQPDNKNDSNNNPPILTQKPNPKTGVR